MRAFIVFVALVLVVAVPLVSANDWIFVSSFGSWEVGERNAWVELVGNDDDAFLTYYQVVENFTGYHASINFTELVAYVQAWYDMYERKYFQWCFSIGDLNGANNVVVNAIFDHYTNTWGILWDRSVSVFSIENDGNYYRFDATARHELLYFDGTAHFLDVSVFRVANNVTVSMRYFGDSGYIVLLEKSFEKDANFFLDVPIWLHYKQNGHGVFRGGMTDEVVEGVWSPDVSGDVNVRPSWWEQITHYLYEAAGNVLPEWLMEDIAVFSGWGGYLFPILQALWGVILSIIPYTPWLLLFYVLDAGITSVTKQSFEPIGVAATVLYGLAGTIVGTVVGIAQTIYDFIHFW